MWARSPVHQEVREKSVPDVLQEGQEVPQDVPRASTVLPADGVLMKDAERV